MNTAREYFALHALLEGKERQINYLLEQLDRLSDDVTTVSLENLKLKAKVPATTRRKAKAETPTPAPTPEPGPQPVPAEEPETQPAVGDPQIGGAGEVTSLEGGRRRRFGL